MNNNNILGVYTVNIDRLVLISPTFHDISGLAVQKHTEHLDSDLKHTFLKNDFTIDRGHQNTVNCWNCDV